MKQQITIYQSGAFGIQKYEATLVKIGANDYAQYKNSPFIHFIPKGKRKPIGLRATCYPYLVVLKGTGYPDPADGLSAPVMSASGLECRESRHLSFDDRYKTEFDEILKSVDMSNAIMDIRHTVGTNLVPQEELVTV